MPLLQLRPILIRASLNYRGWEIPYITAEMPIPGNDWIGPENQVQHSLQAWRFYQSGQFAVEIGFLDDWEDKLTYPVQEGWAPGVRLSILDVVFRLTEIFGLASRLATTEIYRDERFVVVEATPCGLKGRTLYDRGEWNVRLPVFSSPTSAESIPYTKTLPKEDVIARPKELAREAAKYIFERFNWDSSDKFLAAIQSELLIHKNV